MGKKAKEHRKKVQARNIKLKEEKEKSKKLKQNFLTNLINQEKERGAFENNPIINPIEGPMIDPPMIEDGPML